MRKILIAVVAVLSFALVSAKTSNLSQKKAQGLAQKNYFKKSYEDAKKGLKKAFNWRA